MNKLSSTCIIACLILLLSCNEEDELFDILVSKDTGITFNNIITDSESFNILNYEYLYNGGGVGVGDFNQDGLPDLFFAGNMVPNQLYLNEGKLKFKNVSEEASIQAPEKWSTGVSVVDINGDGWDDIYVCGAFFFQGEKLRNMMFVNKGLNENGVPVFVDEALKMGIADEGYSTHASFFDYDLDGDQDLYVLTNQLEIISPNQFKISRVNGEAPTTDRLYRNNGDGTFTNVSREAGILIEGYGLGVNIADFNRDGWPDIYVSNDYLSNDLLWINQKNGTFKNEIAEIFKHQSHSAMGNDVADINNDGLPDVFTLEMLPSYHERRKRMQVENQYSKYVNTEKLNYQYQYMRNTLQLHQGVDQEGLPRFSEVGMLAGVHASDWSWSAIIQDFDHDLDQDIFISNGFPKDVTDMDYMAFRTQREMVADKKSIYEQIPEVNIPNCFFRQDSPLRFHEVSRDIGMDKDSYSNGAAVADLDLDGDLDIVTNNINQEAFIYRNLTRDRRDTTGHFIRIDLYEGPLNPYGSGAHVRIVLPSGQSLYKEQFLYRGYMSTMEPKIHFGLGHYNVIDTLEITWPDQNQQILTNVSADQVLRIEKQGKSPLNVPSQVNTLFNRAERELNIFFRHFDDPFVDFNIQRTLPFQFSQQGPALAVGDVNNDGNEDFIVGGSLHNDPSFFIQDGRGGFVRQNVALDDPKSFEDLGMLLFDMEGDGDTDLYVVSGSYENALSATNYEDRVYVNDGRGNFSRAEGAVTANVISGSCVKGADYDKDGDIDLFVGGRVIPGAYPMPVSSQLLRNESTKEKIQFVDVAAEAAPDLIDFGLVTDAIWTDYDRDNDRDLIIVSEWKPPVILNNENGQFEEVAICGAVDSLSGLWKSITGADIDGDGDTDYVLGNFGWNTEFKASLKRPLRIYAGDYDANGSVDPIIACFTLSKDGSYKSFPMHAKDDLIKQVATMKKRFLKYEEYAALTIDNILTKEEIDGSIVLEANNMSTVVLENRTSDGSGCAAFNVHTLPMEAQLAPVYGSKVADFTGDGLPDILLVGNDYGIELFTGRHDAFNGLLLIGQGDYQFKPVNFASSGFLVPGDAKALALIEVNSYMNLLASQNQDSLLVYSYGQRHHIYRPQNNEDHFILHYEDDRLSIKERYWGDTFLSQSTQGFVVPAGVIRIQSFSADGEPIREWSTPL